jgi:light-regulated signal transduction histidine kinase (bacteriophytochrome)
VDESGCVPVAEIEIGARRGEREDELYVRDNGVGFDMKYVGKLLAPALRARLRSVPGWVGY